MAELPGNRARSLVRSPFGWGFTAGAGALLAVVVLAGVHELATVLMMLVSAFFLAVGLDRPVALLSSLGIRRGWAVVTIVVAGIALSLLILFIAVPVIASQARAFFVAVPGYLEKLFSLGIFSELDENTDLQQRLTAFFTPSRIAGVATGLLSGAATLAGLAFLAGTTAILALFMLGGLDRLTGGAYRLVVVSRRDRVRGLGDAALAKIGGYLVGAVSIAAMAGGTTFVYTLIAGIGYPLLLAVVVAVCDLIPQIGATLGATVVTLVALSESLTLAVITVVFFLCYQGIENWFIYPRFMGHAVQISSLAAIVAALLGGALFGVLGVLIAVPVYASVQLVMREVVMPRQDAL